MHSPSAVSVAVAIITVSTSRAADRAIDDRGGALLAELSSLAGHTVQSRELVSDDPAAISRALTAALGSPAQLILLTGGTGLSARDCTPRIVREHLDREIPGFGELFRMLSHKQVGSKAMLSDAVGGVASHKLVFSLPGSPKACQLAMDELILPEIAHLLGELRKEAALPAAPVVPLTSAVARRSAPAPAPEALDEPVPSQIPAGISVAPMPDAERHAEAPIGSGWEAGLRGLGGTLSKGHPEIPDALSRMQPVVDVLNSAGTRGIVKLANGAEYGAWGFPDLARRGSKVLLVREAEPMAEIIALHRWPELVGLCCEDGALPDVGLALGSFTDDRTGRALEGPGQVFAVEGKAVYVTHQKKVFKWDGSRSEATARAAAEPMSSALASLVLAWSGR